MKHNIPPHVVYAGCKIMEMKVKQLKKFKAAHSPVIWTDPVNASRQNKYYYGERARKKMVSLMIKCEFKSDLTEDSLAWLENEGIKIK